ncbi:Dyp-type peroxidase domain-containing protein [Leucobacter sp. HNU]|uniref:Dyp-type peroxidase domain-containing protein n=1 Tax=Leucobacter sp. HNU TaxID=3236805 RepID=UPI003A800BAE
MPGTEPATVETAAPSASSTRSVSRRGLFGALAGAAGGAAVTAAGFAIAGGVGRSDAESTVERLHGSDRIPCHGAHQAGITTAHTAHVSYLALDLLPGADHDGILRMLRLLSGDIEALTAGTAPWRTSSRSSPNCPPG